MAENKWRKPIDGLTFEQRLEATIKDLEARELPLSPDRVKIEVPCAEKAMWAVIHRLCRDREPQWRDGYKDVADWLSDNKGKGLLLSGPCGTGKTFLAWKVLPVLLEMYHKVVATNFFPASELNGKYEDVTRLKHVLIIDDIGTEGERVEYGERRMVFPEIVDLAERRQTMLIVTTNLNAKDIGEKYGERTLSRLHDITRYVKLKGDDIRKGTGKEAES